jgi:hypothetical protein
VLVFVVAVVRGADVVARVVGAALDVAGVLELAAVRDGKERTTPDGAAAGVPVPATVVAHPATTRPVAQASSTDATRRLDMADSVGPARPAVVWTSRARLGRK